MEYFAFGETFVEEHKNSHNAPWKYNGKELDEETGWYYYGARYYNPRTSIWLSVDPIAGWNPVFEIEHYIEGQHNGGVFNHGNLNVYGYTYQNPLRYIDPNGKQVESEYLGGLGIDFGSFGNGIADGILDASPLGVAKLGWDLATDSQFRSDLAAAIQLIISDPIGTVKAVAESKYEAWSSVLQGEGTEEQQYSVGNDLGTIIGTLISGAGIKSLIKQINKAKSVARVTNIVSKRLTNEAEKVLKKLGSGKGPVYGTKAHAAFSKAVNGMKIGNNTIRTEVSYLNGKIVKHGTKGSARIDAGLYDAKGNLIHVFDLKTGGAKLTNKQVQHIHRQTRSQVPVTEIRGD